MLKERSMNNAVAHDEGYFHLGPYVGVARTGSHFPGIGWKPGTTTPIRQGHRI